MDGAGDGMAIAVVTHGPPFDVIIVFVKHNRDYGVTVKLISGGGGGGGDGEAAVSDEEGDFSNTERDRAGVVAAPAVFSRPENEKEEEKLEVSVALVRQRAFGV